MYRKWIYHKTEAPKVIDYDGEDLDEGWADSPAEFLKLEDVGISKALTDSGDEGETQKAQQSLEAVQGVVDSLNGELNLDEMSKEELTIYAKTHFDLKLDQRKRKTVLVEDIRNHIES